MEEDKWICVNCARSGKLHYIEPSDVLKLPDMIIYPSHNTQSPHCKDINILFKLSGKVYSARGNHSPVTISEPKPIITTDQILALPKEHHVGRIVIIECITIDPAELTMMLLKFLDTSEYRDKIIIQKGLPLDRDVQYLSELLENVYKNEQVLIFVGLPTDYKNWIRKIASFKYISPFNRGAYLYYF